MLYQTMMDLLHYTVILLCNLDENTLSELTYVLLFFC